MNGAGGEYCASANPLCFRPGRLPLKAGRLAALGSLRAICQVFLVPGIPVLFATEDDEVGMGGGLSPTAAGLWSPISRRTSPLAGRALVMSPRLRGLFRTSSSLSASSAGRDRAPIGGGPLVFSKSA